MTYVTASQQAHLQVSSKFNSVEAVFRTQRRWEQLDTKNRDRWKEFRQQAWRQRHFYTIISYCMGRAVEPLEGCNTNFRGSIKRTWVLQYVISQHLLVL